QRLTKSTLSLLDAALGEFSDYEYTYPDTPSFAGLKYPLDCNGLNTANFENELGAALGATVSISSGTHDTGYSGCEVMYFFLNRVPESRQILDKIDKSLITGKDENQQDMTVTVGGQVYPLFRVIDPWGKTLWYSYYNNTNEGSTSEPARASPRTTPLVISLGPDKEFGTDDDIVSE
ncbi:MAG: hypothetical protein WC454_03810, partial [Phycisphaerae bacterium]